MQTAQHVPFNAAAMLARIASLRIASPAPIVLSAATMQRRDTARSMRSIIEECGELDCHEFDPSNNLDSLAVGD